MTDKTSRPCPHCGGAVEHYRNPFPTVDIIIANGEGAVYLIHRKNEPRLWAIPGGFVDYGESLEDAAIREAKEETSLDVTDLEQFRAYSAPDRDPRFHTVSMVFTAKAAPGQTPQAADDADDIALFTVDNLPELAFDHRQILTDYFDSLGE